MLRKLLIISLAFLAQLTFAETCPTIDAIKNHALKAWKFYDTDDSKLLSATRIAQFEKGVEEFALAESVFVSKQKNVINCYYRDKNGWNLNAYLSKDNLILGKNKNYWYEVSNAMHCAADVTMCEFQQKNLSRYSFKRGFLS